MGELKKCPGGAGFCGAARTFLKREFCRAGGSDWSGNPASDPPSAESAELQRKARCAGAKPPWFKKPAV